MLVFLHFVISFVLRIMSSLHCFCFASANEVTFAISEQESVYEPDQWGKHLELSQRNCSLVALCSLTFCNDSPAHHQPNDLTDDSRTNFFANRISNAAAFYSVSNTKSSTARL